jgi:hypothetical protein
MRVYVFLLFQCIFCFTLLKALPYKGLQQHCSLKTRASGASEPVKQTSFTASLQARPANKQTAMGTAPFKKNVQALGSAVFPNYA